MKFAVGRFAAIMIASTLLYKSKLYRAAFFASLLRSKRIDSTSALRMRYPPFVDGYSFTTIKLPERIILWIVPTEHPNRSATSRVDNVWSLMKEAYDKSGSESSAYYCLSSSQLSSVKRFCTCVDLDFLICLTYSGIM